MKLFNIALLTVLNIWAAFAAPSKYNSNGMFYYWLTSNTLEAHISGLGPYSKGATTISVPPYFENDGNKYYVTKVLNGAFANSNVETVVFEESPKTVVLEYESFYNNQKLTKVIVENKNLVVNDGAFRKCNDVFFDGNGIPNLVERLSKNLLENWDLPVGKKDYDYAGTNAREQKKADLYKLAKKIMGMLDNQWGNSNANVASILITHHASSRGYHMLFRELAITMGVGANHILTVSDSHCTFWSLVKFDHDKYNNQWVNVDIYNYNYSKYTGKTYPSDFYMNNSQFIAHLIKEAPLKNDEIHKNPGKWYVYDSRYGTSNEGLHSNYMLIDTYLKKYHLTGDRN
ncbi:hypothetical protein BCR32DRAFT_291074 [Anaeromyces robustus]|uniref:Transglutaminase-like domain-containing protein n=1 Tax=Anaeromyces robustus TaxID=1754192 RepID=A0A1Y1XGB8_9FUNG|nr:hypothetical protein BCR32DRAFT_291074 [Anaeromyces robustus]|eukprot:ORX84809.1 hypothetical protein BCR32DRAFT_291074 [Anaeromyces robustus]